MLDALRFEPGSPPRLHDRPTDEAPGVELRKADAERDLATRTERLGLLQQRLFAEAERAVLLVLQGLDTSGKDGAVKGVFRDITPAATKDEQGERLQARLDDPERRWKPRAGDLEDRARWQQFQAAYEETLTATSTDHAPWYVVPADRKWLRNIVVAEILVRAIEVIDPPDLATIETA